MVTGYADEGSVLIEVNAVENTDSCSNGSGVHNCFPASVHSQAGQGFRQPGLLEGVPARGWGLD